MINLFVWGRKGREEGPVRREYLRRKWDAYVFYSDFSLNLHHDIKQESSEELSHQLQIYEILMETIASELSLQQKGGNVKTRLIAENSPNGYLLTTEYIFN